MERVTNERTKVPSHLSQFHSRTNRSPSLHTPHRTRGSHQTPANSPPRFRLSLRSALKDIVSKDWEGLALHARPRPPRMGSQHPPDSVRMKDSDDYITARAANPRTGLISPSLGMSTPCRQSTPNTPGDALKLRHHECEPDSPTPDTRRAVLSRADEGRKISPGSNDVQYTPHESNWHYNNAIEERAGTPCSTLPEDRLVLHMPSAEEPQPFAYPGYSSEQIEAFEHYRHKARRISNEGYDRRLLQTSRIPSSAYSTPDHEHSPDDDKNDAYLACSRQGHHFQPLNGLHERPAPQLIVRKRNAVTPVCQVGEAVATFADPCVRMAKTSGGTFCPTPTSRRSLRCANEHPKVSSNAPACHCASKLAHVPHVASLKTPDQHSCMTARTRSVVAKNNDDDKNNKNSGCNSRPKAVAAISVMTDLRTLPRVTLVRPEHAALPVSRGASAAAQNGRACSLGCRRDVSNGQCLEQRKVSLPALANDSGPIPAPKAEEVLVGIVAWMLCYMKGIQMPQSDLIETLRSSETTSKEKADALKAALSLAGHVLAVGTALAMIWQLSAAVIDLLRVIAWPLVVPFRILKWLMGAS